MTILRIVPLILGLLLGGFSFKTFSDFKIKKLEKHQRRILTEKKDSINFLVKNLKQVQGSDSLKVVQIMELQGTIQVINKKFRVCEADNKDLSNWKLDAQDGVILKTDTVQLNWRGKIKRRK